MNIIEINDFNNFLNTAENMYIRGPEGLIIGISNDIDVWSNSTSNFISTNPNIKIGLTPYIGGAIVNFPNDLNLAFTKFGQSNFGYEAIDCINEYLHIQNINSTISGNDLMIDNTKVASYTKRAHLNGWYLNIVHFSINTDVELVLSICTKKTNKTPGRLADYNINKEILLTALDPLIKTL